MVGDNYLTPIRMPPLLMAAFLTHFYEGIGPQHSNDGIRVADRKALSHYAVTSINLAVSARGISVGSNHSSRASLALAMASSSVSPAEAQPGSSGKTEEYRPVSESFSTIRRSFISTMIATVEVFVQHSFGPLLTPLAYPHTSRYVYQS